ncbi:MAG: phosphate acyltransferase PlsX, partial [Verrucomicrobia bacterium]|nr:phosphate acyltransferase PlsX [Verrucomicrobiota bacterium]
MVNTSGATGRIAVDAMGGDLGPAEVVAAVKLALGQHPELNPITLVGDRGVLESTLRHVGLALGPRLELHHASEVITMEDKPLNALKRKKDSSMVRAIELVKSRAAGVVVSCGNTGALMAGGTLKLRTMEGVARPALAAICPREGGHFVLIDAGANPEAKAEHLAHNAILGSHFCRVMLGVSRPRVGLMTIGTE